AVFAFVTSWDELVVNLFITSRNVYTLPRKIWDGIHDNINPSVAAVATLLILITLIAMLVRQWQQRRAEGCASAILLQHDRGLFVPAQPNIHWPDRIDRALPGGESGLHEANACVHTQVMDGAVISCPDDSPGQRICNACRPLERDRDLFRP